MGSIHLRTLDLGSSLGLDLGRLLSLGICSLPLRPLGLYRWVLGLGSGTVLGTAILCACSGCVVRWTWLGLWFRLWLWRGHRLVRPGLGRAVLPLVSRWPTLFPGRERLQYAHRQHQSGHERVLWRSRPPALSLCEPPCAGWSGCCVPENVGEFSAGPRNQYAGPGQAVRPGPSGRQHADSSGPREPVGSECGTADRNAARAQLLAAGGLEDACTDWNESRPDGDGVLQPGLCSEPGSAICGKAWSGYDGFEPLCAAAADGQLRLGPQPNERAQLCASSLGWTVFCTAGSDRNSRWSSSRNELTAGAQ